MKRIIGIGIVLLAVFAVWVGIAMAQTTDPNYPIDIDMFAVFLQALVFGGAAPGLAYAFIEWLKLQIPTISPYATRNTSILVSFLFAFAGWGLLIWSGEIPAPSGNFWVWVRYAIAIAGSSGIMNEFFHGTTLPKEAAPEVVAARLAKRSGGL